ncbi:MAG: hypothetical protein MJZ38_04495 [archaeon]|nr:hypothetical protein [archaeon]
MVENTGNSYRTAQAVVAGFIIIAVAVAVILWGATDLGAVSIAGVFLFIVGLMFAVLSLLFNGTPDKFGASERSYRLTIGLLLIVVGAVMIIAGFNVELYITVAVLLIGIAVIGICTALSNSKKTKY